MDILRGGWAPGLLGNGAGLRADSPSTGGSYSAEAEAIFAAFTTPPTTPRKDLIDACVVSLKSAGVWAKLDALYAFAAADSQAAKINWKAPGTYNCTEVNAPAFAADLGFTGASTKYLDSNFNPTTATTPNYVQNSATVFGWSLTNVDVASAGVVGPVTLAVGEQFIIQRQTNNFYFAIHDTDATATANTDSLGFWSASRTDASTKIAYRNGSLFRSLAAASGGINNSKISFMARGANYWTGQIAAGGFGSQLNATEHLALYNALRTYMTGVGVP